MKLTNFLPLSFFLSGFLIIFTNTTFAQPSMGVAIQYNRPIEELRTDGFKDGIGFNFSLLSNSLSSDHGIASLQFGGQFDYVFNGKQSEEIIVTVPETGELGNLYVNNQQVGAHGITRIITTDRFPVQLYVDGMAGVILFTSTESYGHTEECPDESLNLSRDFVFSYGASVGSMIRLSDEAKLDLRATYRTGSPARFIDLRTVTQTEQETYSFNYGTAPATQLSFQLGLSFVLDGNCGGSADDSDYSGSFYSPTCFR